MRGNMKIASKDINQKLAKLRKAQEELDQTIEKVQNECPHDSIAECDYKQMEFFDSLPPLRICLDCGLSEEGWGCGFRVLKEKTQGLQPRKIARDDLYSIRCGKYISQGD